MLSNLKMVLINTAIIFIVVALVCPDSLSIPKEIQWIAPYVTMKALAVLSIFLGSKQSEIFRLNKDEIEHVTSHDARKAPIVASSALMILFWGLKFISAHTVNCILGVYFALSGTFAVNSLVLALTQTSPNLLMGTSSVVVAWSHFLYPNWVTNNILGFSLAVTAITRTHVKDTQTAISFLSLLFLYDIWWVFGTSVMLDVALKIEGPIKLVVPSQAYSLGPNYALLGLGDIVVPGIFVALMYRYDKFLERKKERAHFFEFSLIGYIFGLFLTFTVMKQFNAAQPALLYLVPSLFMFAGGYGWTSRGFTEWWKFTEENCYNVDTVTADSAVELKQYRWIVMNYISLAITCIVHFFESALKELFGIY